MTNADSSAGETETKGKRSALAPSYRLNISSSKAKFIRKILNGLDSEDARIASAYIEKCDAAARSRKTCSLYEPSCNLQCDDIVNGEIVQVLSSLRFFAEIYEPKTAAVMQAAHELILRLLKRAEHISKEKHKAHRNEREMEERIRQYERENY